MKYYLYEDLSFLYFKKIVKNLKSSILIYTEALDISDFFIYSWFQFSFDVQKMIHICYCELSIIHMYLNLIFFIIFY